MTANAQPKARIFRGDVSADFVKRAAEAQALAWDIETSGLDWRCERIGTCQLHVPGTGTAVVQIEDRPQRLCNLLQDPAVLKVFHYAPFDLRFMSHNWNLQARNVACTKLASKLLNPAWSHRDHSLQPLVWSNFRVWLDKHEQASDWLTKDLSESQLEYAIADVQYLLPLLGILKERLREQGLEELMQACFDHLPTRVQLEILGYGDVFAY